MKKRMVEVFFKIPSSVILSHDPRTTFDADNAKFVSISSAHGACIWLLQLTKGGSIVTEFGSDSVVGYRFVDVDMKPAKEPMEAQFA